MKGAGGPFKVSQAFDDADPPVLQAQGGFQGLPECAKPGGGGFPQAGKGRKLAQSEPGHADRLSHPGLTRARVGGYTAGVKRVAAFALLLLPVVLAGCETRRLHVRMWPEKIIPGRQAELHVYVEHYLPDRDGWVPEKELPLFARIVRGRDIGELNFEGLKTDEDGRASALFTSVTGILGVVDIRVTDPYGLESHAYLHVVDPETLDPLTHPQRQDPKKDPWLEAGPRRVADPRERNRQ